jgi:outer membrane protein assembly factor BamB
MNKIFQLFLSFIFFAYCAYSQEVVQWRGENRDGIYNEKGLLKSWPANGPSLLWHFEGLGEGFSSAAVTNDRIYLTGEIKTIGYVFCLSLDGKLIWKVPYGVEWTESTPGSRVTPLVTDGKVYLVSALGVVVCMKADKGTVLWKVDLLKEYNGRNITWGISESLAADGNKLFCTPGGTSANVIALDKNNGKLIWKSPGNGEKSAYCSPLIINFPKRKVLVTMTENSIIGFDAGTGKKLWSQPQTNRYSVHANTPVYSNGQLYCVSGYGKGGVMLKISDDGAKSEVLWRDATLDSKIGGVVLVNGKIYGIGDESRGFHCLDWKTGTVVATDKSINKGGNIISADDMLYTYDEGGNVSLFKPLNTGFKKISSFKVPMGSDQHWAHLVISAGRMYVRHGNSLMVYNLKAK